MTSLDLTPTSFAYIDCDIPVGQTLAEWRRDRNVARRTERRARHIFRLPRLRPPVDGMTALDARLQLGRLIAEPLDATEAGLGENAVYMRALEDDLTAARHAYVGLAVTEIASLRGELSGRQVG